VPLGPVDPENNVAVKSRNSYLAILHPIVYARRFVPMQFLSTGDVPAGDYLGVVDSFADHWCKDIEFDSSHNNNNALYSIRYKKRSDTNWWFRTWVSLPQWPGVRRRYG
jgi:hypothetical protein